MKNKLGLVLAVFFCSTIAFSQNNTVESNGNSLSVSGRIIDETNELPVEYVIVKLYNAKDSAFVKSDVTDSSGDFNVITKSPGKYYLTFSLIGYEPKTVNNVKIDTENRELNLGELKIKTATINLQEVNLIGNYRLKIDVDKKIYHIDNNALGSSGTAGDVLQNIPSVFVSQDGAVTLRGGKVKIYIDGKPSGILGISRSQILDYIPATLIESIEVLNDPSAKYDADGGSGIINIVLKNQKKAGINGMVILGAGTDDKYNGSVNFSYNYKKINFFASYDTKSTNMVSWETKNRESNLDNNVKYVDQRRDNFSKTINQNLRIRTEYKIDTRNTLGFSYLNSKMVDKDATNIGYQHFDNLMDLTKIYDRHINENDRDKSNNVTLNYTKKFNRKEQILTSDLYYSNSNEYTVGDIFQQYYNLDLSPSSTYPIKANTYDLDKETNFVGQIDYTQPLRKKEKIELGFKTRIKTTDIDYKLDYYYLPFDSYITDTDISSHFNYKMNINAGYATYRKKFKSFSYKFGIRAEQSIVNFKIGEDGANNNMNYVDFFPSAHFLKEFKNNNKLTLRYSRRIDRPALREINPLQQYKDPLFLNKGNPNLLPEYTNSFDITHIKSWKQNSISGSIYYRQAVGTIQKVVVLDPAGVTITNYQNLKSSKNIGTELTANFQIYNWWKVNSSVNYYRNVIDGTNIGAGYKSDTYSFNGKLNTNFALSKRTLFQLSGNYQSATYSPFIKNYGQYYVDGSFKQDFLNKKLSISLRCTDLFHTQRKMYDMIGSNYSINSDFRKESRVVFIGIIFRPFVSSKKSENQNENEDSESTDEND